jgi:transposase InsO family protein
MDFVSDSLTNARRLKCLTIADDFSRECVDIAVDFGIGGHYVTRILDQAATFRGYPRIVRTDNGPEFTSRAFIGWCQAHGIEHLLIEPGKPMQNGYIESFNGKFRDECLNSRGESTRTNRLTGEEALIKLYTIMLKGDADFPGYNYWIADYRASGFLAKLCAAFLNSAEYRARFM